MSEREDFNVSWVPGGAAGGPSPYCNNVNILPSFWDFTFEFSQMVPLGQQEDGSPLLSHEPVERLVMSPQHAKAFSEALVNSINQWEQQFGQLPTMNTSEERQ